jgi:hypothetical protein
MGAVSNARRRARAVVLAAVLPSGAAAAELTFMTGSQLLEFCTNTDTASMDRGLCTGYLAGLADAGTTLRHWRRAAPGFCIPRDASPFALRQEFLRYAQENEAGWDGAAAGLAINAFRRAYPCP